MIQYATRDIVDVRYGDTPIKKIYYGDSLVWDKEAVPEQFSTPDYPCIVVSPYPDVDMMSDAYLNISGVDSKATEVITHNGRKYYVYNCTDNPCVTNLKFIKYGTATEYDFYSNGVQILSLANFKHGNNIAHIDISHLDTSSVVDFTNAFAYSTTRAIYKAAKGIKNTLFDTSSATSLNGMFSYCYNTKAIDLSYFNTKNVKDFTKMFYYCINLESIDTSRLDTSNAESFEKAFYRCESVKELDLSNLNLQNITKAPSFISYCTSLTKLTLPRLPMLKINDASSFISSCYSLENIDFNDTNIHLRGNLMYAFAYLKKIKTLDLSKIKITDVKDIRSAFSTNIELTTLILPDNFMGGNSASVDANVMFYGCTNLHTIKLGNDTFSGLDQPNSFGGVILDFSGCPWGCGDSDSVQSLKGSLRNNLYYRKNAKQFTVTLKLNASTKSLLDYSDKAMISLRGYTIA